MLNRLNKILYYLLFLIIFSSCVEHKVSLIVYPDGSYDYDHTASGDKNDLIDFDYPLPTSLDWLIKDNFSEDVEEFYYRVFKHFKKNSKFPNSFLNSDSIPKEILLEHQFSIKYSNYFFYEYYDIDIIYKGRKSLIKYPLINDFLKNPEDPPNGWVFNGLSYIFNEALNEINPEFNLEPIINKNLKNWLNYINNNYDNESLQSNFNAIKKDGIKIISKYLTQDFSYKFNELVNKYENEVRITIDLADDIIEFTTIMPGYLYNSNADSSFNDTLLWRFSGIDLINEDYILKANTSIYHKSRFHWTLTLFILLGAFITLYIIASKVPDPMKISK